MSSTSKKDQFAGYVPHDPEWKAYMMKQPKALIVEVATGIADERDRLKADRKELMEALKDARRRLYIAAAVDAARWTKDTEKQNEHAAKAVSEIDALIAKPTHP